MPGHIDKATYEHANGMARGRLPVGRSLLPVCFQAEKQRIANLYEAFKAGHEPCVQHVARLASRQRTSSLPNCAQ